ncbi:hypothetical protein PG993_005145 [Apiospora rasikravindrae]|uniref:Major facilitator superfamily (MFS) profile domain-containing protein n=1 Tax=Apiospora rasikravindrae TaxID=990691 RepID=A0ABR1TER5_9PEZI
MPLSPHTYQFLVGVFASVGSILYGYDLGVIAGVVGSQVYKDQFSPGMPDGDPVRNGAVVSLFTGGAVFGAFFAGPSGDWFGRRWTIFIGSIIFILGGAMAGLGVGFLTMIIPVYQGEICHPSIRGRVTGLQQFMLGIGALVATWLTWGTNVNLNDERQWRIPLGIQIIPAIILAALIFIFPESPRWLIDHNQAELGLQTLARLHANGNTNDAWVQAEYAQIQETIAFEHEHEAKSYTELFTKKSAFRRLFLAVALQASVQMTGVSAIQYFSVNIFKQIGISQENALKYQAINSILALIAQMACLFTIDKFGRRWTLITGNLMPKEAMEAPAGGFIIVTWLYNISFSYACGPLSWIIPAEIFDTHTRSKGVSIATMVSFAFNTMIGQVTDIAIQNVGGWRYFIVFTVCNFTNALFFWLVLPETKQIPLEEMNYLFTNAPWIVVGADKSKYRAGLGQDLERRAAEVREKGVHEEEYHE